MSDVLKALREADAYPDTLRRSDFDVSQGVAGSRERVATKQMRRPHALREDQAIMPALMAYESFDADGTGGDNETFALGHSVVESGATDTDVVVYEDGARVSPVSVDYDANTVTVAAAANATVDIFYASDEQARVVVAKTAPGGSVSEVLWSGDIGLLHLRDHAREPVMLNLTASALQAVVPTDWRIDIFADAPYVTAFETADGNEAVNALLDLHVRATMDDIDGLDAAVRADAASR